MSNGNQVTALSEAIKQLVADRGLGAISKKDYELLVFHHLTKDPELVGQSNYVLANHFKVTETKVKSLRLEASLRHQPADHKAVLRQVAQRVLDQAKNSDIKSGKVIITLEDPVQRREFEYAAKQANHRVEYGFNRENLEISLTALFEVVLSNVEDRDKALRHIVQGEISDKSERSRLLNQCLLPGQKVGVVSKYLAEKGFLTSALTMAISTLGGG